MTALAAAPAAAAPASAALALAAPMTTAMDVCEEVLPLPSYPSPS